MKGWVVLYKLQSHNLPLVGSDNSREKNAYKCTILVHCIITLQVLLSHTFVTTARHRAVWGRPLQQCDVAALF